MTRRSHTGRLACALALGALLAGCKTHVTGRAQVLQWQFFEQYQHEPTIAVVRFLLAYSGEPEKHTARIAELTPSGYVALDATHKRPCGSKFIWMGLFRSGSAA